jgi:aerobic-type carbon monoxide dehydrogenase small subunit (CoxS/CutS family)
MSLPVEISFTLNGSPVKASVPASMTALSMLRDVLNVTGTKYGCGEGECGACTILVDGLSVNSCLMFAVECDGRTITTVEGVAADPANDPLRDSLVEHGGVQCGFCTPGMVVQSKWLLNKHPHPTRQQIERGLEGNICRCTGYKKIVDAVVRVTGSNE